MKRKTEPTREEIIGFLQRAADEFERGKPGTVLHWLGERLRAYLDGDARTLQQAIGIPTGRSTNRRRNIRIAVAMRRFKSTAAARQRGAIKEKRRTVAIAEGMRGLNLEKAIVDIERRYKREAADVLKIEKVYARRKKVFSMKK